MYGAFLATVAWPIAWLLSAVTFRVSSSHQRKDLAILTMFLILGTVVGLILWTLPIILIAIDGGPQRYYQLVQVYQISSSDFMNLLKAELVFLFVMLFSYVYHEVTIDTIKYEDDVAKSWHHRHDEVGMTIVLSEEQTNHLKPLLAHAPNKGKDTYVEDLLYLLNTMPGWVSDSTFDAPDFWEKLYDSPRSFFAKLRDHHGGADQRGLWSLDIYVFWSQYHEKATSLVQRLNVNFHKLVSTVSWMVIEIMKMPVMCFVIFLLAVFRATIPRMWTSVVLGGPFFPSEVCPLILSLYSSLVFFLISFVWLWLFYIMVVEYEKQLCQVVLVSALVDPKMRMTYMQMYLPHETKEQKHDAERIMCNLPLINLKIATNANAFWKLREFCTLSRSNERMGMHVLMDMVVFWFTLNLLITLAGLFVYQALPPTVPVMVFDIFCFGFLLLRALQAAMKVNQYMDDHESMLKQARYDLCVDLTQMSVDVEPSDSSTSEKLAHSNTMKLLDQYVCMVQSYEGRDKILLNMEVTPSKLAGSVLSIVLALVTISIKLYSMGVFNTLLGGMRQHDPMQTSRLLRSSAALAQNIPQVQFMQKISSMIKLTDHSITVDW
jgi:hypothetical protein